MDNGLKTINPEYYSNWNSSGQLQEIAINNDHKGLTKREYFAGLAMQGFLANNQSTESFNFQGEPKYIIEYAIQCADELLKQLESNQK